MTAQSDISIETVPGDHLAPEVPVNKASLEMVRSSFALTPVLSARLASLAEQENVLPSSLCLAAYSILLSRYRNTSDVDICFSSNTWQGNMPQDRWTKCDAVVRIDCLPNLSVRELLRSVMDNIAAAVMSPRNDKAQCGAESCRAAFRWENAQQAERAELCCSAVSTKHEGFDVSLTIRSHGSVVEPALLYRSDLFEADTIDRVSRHWQQLIEDMANNPEATVGEIAMLPADERAMILDVYAGNATEYPQLCIHQLFAEQVVLHSEAEAVIFGAERLTYRELDQRSNQVANFLVAERIQPEDRIGIFMDRSVEMIVAMLGILKAGGTYLPIDIDYPEERLRFLAEDAELRLVLTQKSLKGIFPSIAPSVYVDKLESPIRSFSTEPVENRSTPESIAVVNYTSGSTGQPKAACIPHRAIVRTVRNTNYIQVIPEKDRVAQAGSPSFDAAIMEIWLALANGAAVVGLRRETLLSLAQLPTALRNERVSILVLNTSYVHQIGRDAPEALKGVRKVLFGGEAAEPGPLRKLLQHVGPGVLVNSYGPAEGCVITSYHEITYIAEDATTVPIGRPVSNARVYLLDPRLQPVPIGVTGELYIGGEGVARGYLNRPELTAQRFIPDIFSPRQDRLLYRTGDFARMRDNGEIEFLGRNDEQVKIRGHRIELAEVRHAISSHLAVKQLFLMVREDVPGDKRLVAYIVPQNASIVIQDSLRQHAMTKLPAEMVPAAFVIVESIPLNTNGKVDRRALPRPSDRPELAALYHAPETNLERKLTLMWQELLRLDHIGVNDNFFDLGGHSLLAARLVARIEKQMGTNIPMATLFEAPTIAQLASRLKQRSYEGSWSPLVELYMPEEISTAKPFFCVHSLGANLVSFHKIAALMRGDRPIYGLQPHGLDGREEPFESIELMATAYLEEIRKKQPQGPYYIGGICLGGVIAYEIAQQLGAAGEVVALLVLIDSYAPAENPYLHSRSPLNEYLDRHLGEMLLLPGVARLGYIARWLSNGGIRFGRALGFQENSSLARATRKVAKAHRHAIFTYKPKPYAGKLVQLMCGDASHRSYEDRRLAWSSLAPSGFEVRLVPGNHLTMVEEPHAQILAQELQFCFDRVTGTVNRSSLQAEQGQALTRRRRLA
jgi:amino acid adenylation domain-containing protein